MFTYVNTEKIVIVTELLVDVLRPTLVFVADDAVDLILLRPVIPVDAWKSESKRALSPISRAIITCEVLMRPLETTILWTKYQRVFAFVRYRNIYLSISSYEVELRPALVGI